MSFFILYRYIHVCLLKVQENLLLICRTVVKKDNTCVCTIKYASAVKIIHVTITVTKTTAGTTIAFEKPTVKSHQKCKPTCK